MAHLHARLGNDKKRNNGSFVPQGKNGRGKKKQQGAGPSGHKNKFEQFSKAGEAQARLEARKAADEALRKREAEKNRHRGYKSRH